MQTLKSSVCKSCKAQIHWIETTKGKNMPCNLQLQEWPPGVSRYVVKVNGEVWNMENAKKPISGYESHFSTCPDAKKWRRDG